MQRAQRLLFCKKYSNSGASSKLTLCPFNIAGRKQKNAKIEAWK